MSSSYKTADSATATKPKNYPAPRIDSIEIDPEAPEMQGAAAGQILIHIAGSNLLGGRGLQDTRVVLINKKDTTNQWRNPLEGSTAELLKSVVGPGQGKIQIAVYTYYLIPSENGEQQFIEKRSNSVEFTFPKK